MKLRLPPRVVKPLGMAAVNALSATWRLRKTNPERELEAINSDQGYVILLWHEAILPLLWCHRHRGVVVVAGRHRDAQYLADAAESWGYRSIRGSSSRGAREAALGLVRELRNGSLVAVTPDGPRGPRRTMKPGPVQAAQAAGARLMPIHATATRAWHLNSWDRFMIPKPFALISVSYGEPFSVEAGPDGLRRGLERAQAGLAALTRMEHGPKAP